MPCGSGYSRRAARLVEGARVTLIQNEGRGGFQWGYSDSSWDDSVTAKVNEQGWAEFPTLAFGKGTVVVRAKGFSRMKLDWLNDEEEFNVFLEPESKLTGTVLDEEGKPVSGARIMLSWGKGEMINIAIDEKDGRFLAEGLGSGKFLLSVIPSVGPGLFSSRSCSRPARRSPRTSASSGPSRAQREDDRGRPETTSRFHFCPEFSGWPAAKRQRAPELRSRFRGTLTLCHRPPRLAFRPSTFRRVAPDDDRVWGWSRANRLGG